MSIRALQEYTYYSKYARYNAEQNRRETWHEAVDRVMDMHLRRYPQAKEEIEWVRDLMKEKRVLGSQRALQFGGKPIEKNSAKLYNCCMSHANRIRFFQESFWLLLCGCGTGYSMQKHHIAKLPTFDPVKQRPKKIFTIPDSIEGWADSLGVLLASYFKHPDLQEYRNCDVEFDYSQIRPAGSPLSSSAGKAPGPEPLQRSLEIIRNLLDEKRNSGMKRLRPIDAYDITMHASDAVLSGGIRRSASICIFSLDDEEMIHAKTGNWFRENPQRGRSNNSAMLVRNEVTKEQFAKLMDAVKQFGEPGFIWSDSTESVSNPCFHSNTRIATDQGLIKISDLHQSGETNMVTADNRIGKDELFMDTTGVTSHSASPVKMTQRNAKVYEVRTEHGYTVKATLNHTFPTPNGRVQLRDLKPGDTLFLQSDEGSWGNVGTYEQGLILGAITGDGTFCSKSNSDVAILGLWEDDFDQEAHLQTIVNEEIAKLPLSGKQKCCPKTIKWCNATPTENSKKKTLSSARIFRLLNETLAISNPRDIKVRVPECVWQGSRDFVIGYLQGMFFANGSVQLGGSAKKATLSLRLAQPNEPLLKDIQILLTNFGVVSRIYQRRKAGYYNLPDGNGGRKPYWCRTTYELIINRPNLITFREKVGLFGRKRNLCEDLLNHRGYSCRKPERYITKIVDINYVCDDDVYCLNQPDTNSVIAMGVVTGNCVEIATWPVHWKTKKPGWAMCNLSEINGKKVKCKEDFALAARGAAILGTLQAGYTDFSYLGKTSEEIVRKEALLGVSVTGMQDNPHVTFNPKLQREMAQLVIETNDWMSKKIKINPAARTTCVKPSGSASLILGSASGVHPHHARRYFRRIQANEMEEVFQHFKQYNPQACDKSVWSANKTDGSVTFCIEVPDGAKTKNDISAVELLGHVKTTQQNWVTSGKQEKLCTQKWLSHSVSNTINVRPDEWDEVTNFIYKNREWFAGVSLLPTSGDLDYPQAPMVNVHTPREILRRYGDGALLASGLIVDGLAAFRGNLWAACDAALGLNGHLMDGETEEHQQHKEDWCRRVRQFAVKYCDGDVRRCTYLMKEVNNWKKWLDLRRSYVDVDYMELVELEDNTKPLEEVACSGGACELI